MESLSHGTSYFNILIGVKRKILRMLIFLNHIQLEVCE